MWFRESKYAWMMLAFLWIFNFFGSLSRFATGYFQNSIVNDLGVSHSFVSASWSLNMLIGAICMPIGGMLVDKYGPKRVMTFSALSGAFGMGLINLIPNWIGFLIGFGIVCGLTGIGATTSYVLMLGWFKTHRAKAMAILSSASALGIAVLAPIFSAGAWITWNSVYFLASLIGLCLITPIILLAIRDPKKDEAEKNADAPAKPKSTFFQQISDLVRLMRHPVILIVGFALFSCGYNMSTVDAHLVSIHEHNHVSLAMKTTALSILGLVEVCGALMFGYLLDRMSRSLALATLYFVRSLSFIALIVVFDVSPIVFSLLFGASFLGAIPGGMLVAGEATENTGGQGGQIGLLLLLHQLGGVLGALTGGVVVDLFGSYNILVILNISLAFLSAAGYFYVHKRLRKPAANVQNAVA